MEKETYLKLDDKTGVGTVTFFDHSSEKWIEFSCREVPDPRPLSDVDFFGIPYKYTKTANDNEGKE